jgi:flagellar protein FlaG
MVSQVISESIMIIVVVIIIGMMSSAIYSIISSIGSSMLSASVIQSQRLVTDIQIVYATNTSKSQVIFFLQNIGESIINLNSSIVYFGPQGGLNIIPHGRGSTYWVSSNTTLLPGFTAQINITLSYTLQKGQVYTIMFNTQSGFTTSYNFEVG